MKDGYRDNKKLLAEQILLFKVFLQRSDMVSPEDKEKIDKELKRRQNKIRKHNLTRQLSNGYTTNSDATFSILTRWPDSTFQVE